MMKTVLLLAVTLSAAWAMSEADLDKMNYTVTKVLLDQLYTLAVPPALSR